MTHPSTSKAAAPVAAARPRDIRLDFFRGLAMIIILIAHVPGNVWALWIPARFGFSDATEMFVFCSGMASALAFGARYGRDGYWPATARVARRMSQVYGAHLLMFFAVLALCLGLVALKWTGRDYVGQLNLYPFLVDGEAWQAGVNRLGLFTLTYVPNYFDILPMYLVVLALLPPVMAIAGVSRWLVLVLLLGLWLGAQSGLLWLPAEPWTDREWFFNPFGWQLLFFTGFAFVMGWLPAPRFSPWLFLLAVAFVLVSVPAAYFRIHQHVEWAAAMREALLPFIGKTDFGVLRYLHFLALAYCAYHLAGEGGRRLLHVWTPLREAILAIGRQALIVFITSMVLAQVIGFVFNLAGRSTLVVALGNLAGFAILVVVARTAAHIKRRLRDRSKQREQVSVPA
jgi:hypothetical protein